MSAETSQWLNLNTLIGFTSEEYGRGEAWHYRAELQGDESNHYPHAIPFEDVNRRLFYWEPRTLTLRAFDEQDGPEGYEYIDNSRQVIVRPDTHTILGVFRDGYQIHGYRQFLIEEVENVLDLHESEGLQIGSAGLLQGGAVAWVQFEFPKSLQYANVSYRSFFTAYTSLNGKFATGYTSGNNLTVCDNTLIANIAAASVAGQISKRRHTKNSLDDLQEIRDTLGVKLQTVGEDFAKSLEVLLNTPVSGTEWNGFLDVHAPLPKDEANKRGTTRRLNYRDKLESLYTTDERVAPWNGTAFGVVQAVNTYEHHLSSLKAKTNRGEANTLSILDGKRAESDNSVISDLNKVFAAKRRKQIPVGV